MVGALAKVQRLWEYSRPFRKRYGTIAGGRLARVISAADYRGRRGELVSVTVPGWLHPVQLRAHSSDTQVFRQLLVKDPVEMSLQPVPRRIIDGGANIGLASLIYAGQWPDAKIVGIELEPGNLELARRNCRHLPNIELRHAALWGSSGTVSVVNPDAEEHCFRAEPSAANSAVRAFRVGELLDDLSWEEVDLVKLDIEGAERVVLGDHAAWLPRVRHLLVELHDHIEPGCTAAFDAAVDRDVWDVRRRGEYLLASRRSG